VPDFHVPKESLAVMSSIRGALEEQRVMRIEYADGNDAVTERCVRPLSLAFWGKSWTLAAWCEMREDFRTFRIDRVRAGEMLERTFEEEPGRSLEDFFARMRAEYGDERERARSLNEAKREGRAMTSDRSRALSKPPRLDLSPAERRALARARLTTCELGDLSGEEVFRRTEGAIAPDRAEEIAALASFQRLGSVGLECARDFVKLGFSRRDELKGRDPVELYRRMCAITSTRQDPCVEDVFRCAIAQVDHADLPEEFRAWHRWTPLRGEAREALPDTWRRAT
jgi:hypothetical protein